MIPVGWPDVDVAAATQLVDADAAIAASIGSLRGSRIGTDKQQRAQQRDDGNTQAGEQEFR
jgi:hypothetical protein